MCTEYTIACSSLYGFRQAGLKLLVVRTKKSACHGAFVSPWRHMHVRTTKSSLCLNSPAPMHGTGTFHACPLTCELCLTYELFTPPNGQARVKRPRSGNFDHHICCLTAWLYCKMAPDLVWFPDPSSGGEREGSGELPAACADLWHFNLMNLVFRTWTRLVSHCSKFQNFDLLPYILVRTNQSL